MSSKKDLLTIASLLLTLPFFFYKLGQTSLISWDEAWYADIARHIARTGDLFNLVFNGLPYSDHPPGGFWLTALIFKLFGISEFTARLSSAITAYLSLIVVYFLGKELFTRLVGFCAALSLASTFWFLYRARAGDLDAPLTFFFVLTFYLGLKVVRDRRFFIPFSFSLTYLSLIKSMLPLAIIPALILIFWRSKLAQPRNLILPVGLVIIFLGGWLLTQWFKDPNLVYWHISHSFRRASTTNDFGRSFQLFIDYLHSGLGKWFWPVMAGVLGSLVLRQQKLYYSLIFIICYSVPFWFSPEVQIWQLIPLYPFLLLNFYGASWLTIQKLKVPPIIATASLIIFTFYVSLTQFRAAWLQFIDIPAFVSDEAILSRAASQYPEPLILDGNFDPAGAFYADKPVTKLYVPIAQVFANQPSFLLISNLPALDQAGISPTAYTILKTDRDKVLIRKNF